MQSKKLILASKGFILLSAFSFLSVSLMAFSNPQSVMDLVAVKLTNNDAFSSIRGVFGGVGLALFISLLYSVLRDLMPGLGLLCLLWGLYAVSRIITIFKEGALGSFGTQWLLVESVFFSVAIVLYFLNKRKPQIV